MGYDQGNDSARDGQIKILNYTFLLSVCLVMSKLKAIGMVVII